MLFADNADGNQIITKRVRTEIDRQNENFTVLAIFSLSSCRATKEVAKETFVESLADPRSGAQVFVRKHDTEAYSINAAGMIKGRKEARKRKAKEVLENY